MSLTPHKKPLQYTVRGVPRSVDRALREKAKRERKSFNQVLVEALARDAGLGSQEPVIHTDLDFLIGTWVSDPATEAAFQEMRQVDERDWKP